MLIGFFSSKMFCISDFYTDGKDGNWLMEKGRKAMDLKTFSVPAKRPACLWDSDGHFITEAAMPIPGFNFCSKLTAVNY